MAHVERRRAGRLRRRLHDWTHRVTASLIAWATRRGVTTIVWDDAVGGYLPTYPWQQFVATLTDKAAVTGIRVLPARVVAATDEASTIGHLQAEARARPGTLAGRDRSWERAQAPEITGYAQAPPGRSDSESDSESGSSTDSYATPIVEGRSSGSKARRASSIQA